MKFFNTDGIRARALDLICSNLCLRLGQVLGKQSNKILIGYDTRISSPQIVDLLINGIVTQGCDMEVLGVIPTPMMSFLLRRHKADYGIVVTASHNPYYDNGIKVFSSSGEKIDSKTVEEIERRLGEEEKFSLMGNLGKISYLSYNREYIDDLNAKIDFRNPHKIVVDLANGAFSSFQNVFHLDHVDYIHALPDGRNINDGVGALYADRLVRYVKENEYDYGFAFDGDGDRLLMVDRNRVYTGDDLLYLLASESSAKKVALSVAANRGLIKELEKKGVETIVTPVGDGHILSAMKERNADLGGEPSGHLLFSDRPYSDSMDSLIRILRVLSSKEEFSTFKAYHTFEINLSSDHPLYKKENQIEERVGKIKTKEDYLLIRESGTEDVLRVQFQSLSEKRLKEVKNLFAEEKE